LGIKGLAADLPMPYKLVRRPLSSKCADKKVLAEASSFGSGWACKECKRFLMFRKDLPALLAKLFADLMEAYR
jgi:hypothetical protein